MPHTLILGITGTGKTTLAVELASRYKRNRINVIVLDPDRSSKWPADYLTDDPLAFANVVKTSKSCAVFVDEVGKLIKQGFLPELEELATNSRKRGHNCHFISQRAAQVHPNIRTQCVNVFLFKQGYKDAASICEEFATDEFLKAPYLEAGEYLGKIGVSGAVFRARIFKEVKV